MNGHLARLSNLRLKLQRDPPLFKEYDDKIKQQLAEGIVEEAPATTKHPKSSTSHTSM